MDVKKEIKENKKMERKAKLLTLDEIEEMQTDLALACDDTNFFLNAKKIEMLEKIANMKVKRMALEKEQTSNTNVANVKPIEVKFVEANTVDQKQRLERLETKVLENKSVGGNDA